MPARIEAPGAVRESSSADTDRALCLVIDASASMAFRSERAPAAKLAYAALIGAALARIALGGSDPVGLSWVGGERGQSLPATSGRATFDRVVGCLERIRPGGDLRLDAEALERSLAPVARQAGRGSIIVLLSDLLDLPEGAVERVTALSTHQRTVLVVRVLDPVEASFPFDGPVRLRALEGNALVETNAETARADYLRALRRIATEWNERLLARGGRVIETVTTDDPVQVVRDILLSAEGKAR
jgi:uncharacterized protein (DUF58 family)